MATKTTSVNVYRNVNTMKSGLVNHNAINIPRKVATVWTQPAHKASSGMKTPVCVFLRSHVQSSVGGRINKTPEQTADACQGVNTRSCLLQIQSVIVSKIRNVARDVQMLIVNRVSTLIRILACVSRIGSVMRFVQKERA